MEQVERSLKTWLNNSLVKLPKHTINEVLEKTEFVINDGLFEHHKTFAYIGADNCLYYFNYFGKGWNKRRPDKNGWCKYLGYSMYNIDSHKIISRRDYLYNCYN